MKKISLSLISLIVAILVSTSFATAQTLSIDLGNNNDPSLTGRVIQGFLLIGILSIAPGLIIMCTSYLKIIVVLSLVRTGIGLQNTPPNMVITSLAMFLTFFVMQPYAIEAWDNGLEPMLNDTISQEAGIDAVISPFKDFMIKHTRDKDLDLFENLSKGNKDVLYNRGQDNSSTNTTTTSDNSEVTEIKVNKDDISLRTLIPAFMISEIKRGFEIGFKLMLPFLAIDIIISSLLMSMSMMMLPPVMISLPFKVIFVVLVDGWYLISGSLVGSYV